MVLGLKVKALKTMFMYKTNWLLMTTWMAANFN